MILVPSIRSLEEAEGVVEGVQRVSDQGRMQVPQHDLERGLGRAGVHGGRRCRGAELGVTPGWDMWLAGSPVVPKVGSGQSEKPVAADPPLVVELGAWHCESRHMLMRVLAGGRSREPLPLSGWAASASREACVIERVPLAVRMTSMARVEPSADVGPGWSAAVDMAGQCRVHEGDGGDGCRLRGLPYQARPDVWAVVLTSR